MKKYFTGKVLALLLVLWWSSGTVAGFFGTVMALAGYNDAECRIIPNSACLFIMLLGLCEIAFGPAEMVKWRIVNILISIVLFLLIKLILRDNIGTGDIKLLIACSFCMNITSLMIGLAFACLLAGIIGILTTKSLKKEMPLAPFMALTMSVVKMAETL